MSVSKANTGRKLFHGVVSPNQFPAVASDACLALVLRGKVSPMTTHAIGPHVMAKDAMNMQAETIITMPELS